MTAAEFRDALRDLDLSQRSLARDLGTATSTVNRWAVGTAPIPPYVPYVLRLLRERREIAGLVEA
jgi:DNA-binding transcriptional regulator YiaG